MRKNKNAENLYDETIQSADYSEKDGYEKNGFFDENSQDDGYDLSLDNEEFDEGGFSGSDSGDYRDGTVKTDGENGFDEDFLTVKFNKVYRTLSRDEAVKYAQLGLKFERFEPMLSKLDYLAAVSGMTREEYVNRLIGDYEDGVRTGYEERFGDDEETVSKLTEYDLWKGRQAYENMRSGSSESEQGDERDIYERLADEYSALVKEFPELSEKSFSQLPEEVKRAGFEGRDLLSAYLYYRHNLDRQTRDAQELSERQSGASAGSMRESYSDGLSSDEQRYIKSMWAK